MSNDKTIFEAMTSLNESQQVLLGHFMHISLHKGRIMGKMEAEGKTAKEIAEVLHVEEKLIEKALSEDSFNIIAH